MVHAPLLASRCSRQIAEVVLCLGLACSVVAAMVMGGYPLTHSTHFNLSWVFQYQTQVDGGQWYPRWLEFSNYGFGNPTFAFYPPLCMVSTLPFHWMGLDLPSSLIASLGLATFVFVAGIYLYSRLFFHPWISAIVASLAASTPYVWLDLYHRGAIAESWGIALVPWLLWTSQQIVDRPRCGAWPVVGVGIAYGFLILSHLPTLLMVSLLWVWLPLASRGWRNCRAVAMRLCGGGLLGGSWTAAYLWPVLCDRHWTQIEVLNALEDYRPQNRLMLDGVLSLRPQFADHWFDRILIYPWLAAVVWVSTALLIWAATRRPTITIAPHRLLAAAGCWLVASSLALLMTTDILGWSYPLLPPLQRIQFSWRWMTVLCTTVPMLLGYMLSVANRSLRLGQRSLPALLFTIVLVATVANLRQSGKLLNRATFEPVAIAQFTQLASRKQFPDEPALLPRQPFLHWHWIHPDGLGLVDVPEYRHRDASLGMPPDRVYPLLEWREGSSQGLIRQRWEYGMRQFSARNSTQEPRFVLLRTFYYPGWITRLDGRTIPTDHNEIGQIQVTVPPGPHTVTLQYRGTPAHRLGLWVTGITLTVVPMGSIAHHQKNRMARLRRLRKPVLGELE